jgi:hypothetical protein
MRRLIAFLFTILLFAGAVTAGAQVVPSATGRQVSITAGGMVSGFQPDFEYDYWTCGNTCILPPSEWQLSPYAGTSNNLLFGVGAYVDVRLRRWVQFEAEGRWLRWNANQGVTQDNYLIGPRLPVYRFWKGKATVYGKALGGYSQMNYGSGLGTGRYLDVAFGGGMDIKLTKKISLRAVDAEYHYWPNWEGSTLSPYGASVGVSYKIF